VAVLYFVIADVGAFIDDLVVKRRSRAFSTTHRPRAKLQFIRAGGYSQRELWSDDGWAWLSTANVEAPKYWMRDGDDWCVRVMDKVSFIVRS